MKTMRLVEILLLAALLSGCNEDGFYEKEYLEAQGKDPNFITSEENNPEGTPDDEIVSGGITDPGTGSGSGTGTGSGSGSGTGTGSGSGSSCVPQNFSQNFTQNIAQASKLDILWVIDDSGSMGDEQAALAYNFDAFINEFITKGTDFRMAITTTDTSSSTKDGKLHGSILSSVDLANNETAFLNNFSDYVQVGTNGAGDEKGLRASRSFLTKHGANFLRPDAYLIVVYVSDEQDDSSNTVDFYVQALRSFKSSPGLVKAYSIVNTVTPSNQYEEIGTRYISATNSLGGSVSNIKQDFYSTLSSMGTQLVDLADSFAINNAAIAPSIEVRVNGNLQASGWSYNASTFSIMFDEQSLPTAGASINVQYQGVCQ